MKRVIPSIALGVSLVAAHAAGPQKTAGVATLANPPGQPMEKIIKGVAWRCEGARCVAQAEEWPGLDSFMKRCATVAAALGPLVAFHSGGRSADKRDIAACNRLAKS